jgi:DNA topoisomerase-1
MGEQFVSIPKGEDLSSVDLDRAIQIIHAKQKEDALSPGLKKNPSPRVKAICPFIKWNDLFINIPRAYNLIIFRKKIVRN